MHSDELPTWQHSHTFGQDRRRPGESRTLIVIALTGSMMVVEVVAGVLLGSMALLADGLHMASHTVALGVNVLAYVYARRHARDERYSFGTGKVNTLGGFTGALLLAVFAVLMVWESLLRLLRPVEIVFDQAILVAVIGLVVNGVCVFILGGAKAHEHEDEAALRADGGPGWRSPPVHAHTHGDHDHNLQSAYLHVLADALTSVLAIVALLAAKYLGLVWMDPLMGILGAILVARWSVGLLRSTSRVLLDRQGPEALMREIREGIESDLDSRLTDLHLWAIGPDIYAAVMTIVAQEPGTPEDYRRRIAAHSELVHVSFEIHRQPRESPARR
jgi:cation diffusion facilitator family transporter